MKRWSSLIALFAAFPLVAAAQPADVDPDVIPDEGSVETTVADPVADVPAEPEVVDEPPVPAAAVTEAAPVTGEEPESAVSGDNGFMDVRLNFTLTNENLFAEPGETIPSVPGWRFGRPNSLGTLFFDNYDTRFSGYETLSHAVLYRNYKKDHLEVEGAFVLRINDLAERKIELSDAGSYLLTSYWFDKTRQDPKRITLTAFPTSSDRFRLGYSYRLSWGGSEEYRRSRQSVPGVKIQFDQGKAYAFVGAKSAVVLNRESAEEESVLAFLAGAGVDVTPMIRVEVNGGAIDRGSNELQDVIAEKVQLYGVSTQVAIHKGMPVSSSIDYKLYRNDPERVGRLFSKTEYEGGLSWLASAEATMLGQTLKDPEMTGSTKVQTGAAADLNLRVKFNRTRFRLDVQYRDLAFILHSTPSLPTFSDFPAAYDKAGNYFAAVGVDQNWNDKWTAGIVLGIDQPATLTTPTGVIPGDLVNGSGVSTAVIRSAEAITILPEGKSALPQYAAKFTGRLDFADMFAAILDVYYTYDPNQTRLTREGPEQTFQRVFGEFNQLGVNATLQAKF